MSTEDDILRNADDMPNDLEQLKAIIARQAQLLAVREQTVAQHEAAISHRTQELMQREQVIAQHEVVISQHTETIARHEAIIASQHDTIESQQRKLEALQQKLTRLLRERYGPRKERIDASQLTLFTQEELAQLITELQQGTVDSISSDDGSSTDATATGEPAADASTSQTQKKGHGRRPIPPEIPRETVVHELSDVERMCPCCGKLRKEIGREVTEELEYIPARLTAIQHQRVRYACEACEENIALAPKPPQPIEKGLPGPGLLAHVILSKYGDYLPLYRQEDILSRSGILIRRSTLCDWVASAADLLAPLYKLICDRVKRSAVIHTDDTGIKMLSIGQCLNCHFWGYIGDGQNPYAAYEFSMTREGKNPSRFLEGYQGYLHADAFSGYDQVYDTTKITEVACMAHCRRYWWDARETDSRRAHEALGYIGRLYQLEQEFEKVKLTGDALRDARQLKSVPVLNAFEIWLKKEQPNVLPKSLIGKAFTYTLNQWQALCRYTESGALAIDNNLAERMMKLPAIGRKNWLFVGSELGGQRAAILLSIIASAKLCGVEPWAWLNALLTELPQRRGANPAPSPERPPDKPPDDPPDLSDLLPDVWLEAHPENRWKIDDIRKVERDRSKKQKAAKRNSKGQ